MKSLICILMPVLAAAANNPAAKVTFSKDVAPLLNARCVECHRAGETAPMTFTSFKDVRPYAKAIKDAVISRRMPPWLADPHYGQFSNERRLSDSEINTIVSWVAAGAPEGDPKDLPPQPKFATGWSIGKPDLVIDMGEDFPVPASGTVPYKYFTVPTNFTEDKWIQAAEIRQGNRRVVHHVIVFLVEPGVTEGANDGGNLLSGWAPGEQALRFEPGTAKLVRAGSKFRFQMHYTPSGAATTDRSYIGLKFSSEPPKRRAITGRAMNVRIKIPAGAENHEERSTFTAKNDIEISGFMPHMHVRGKSFQYTVVYPDGRDEVVLNVPKYDFNWQLAYELKKPLVLPKGARVDCVAHYDNSANNRFNPDPTKDVKWGDQTWEEMMIGWFTYTVPGPAAAVSQLR